MNKKTLEASALVLLDGLTITAAAKKLSVSSAVIRRLINNHCLTCNPKKFFKSSDIQGRDPTVFDLRANKSHFFEDGFIKNRLTAKSPRSTESPDNTITRKARTQEAADHFSVSKMTLHRWAKQKGFPQPLKRGSVVLYDLAAIDAWLAGNGEYKINKEDESVCPFCSECSIKILTANSKPNASSNAKGFQVECINCGARGPCGYADKASAKLAWEMKDHLVNSLI